MWQFSFLNTGLLFFAAATVLPLLIWLLAKRKPKEIVFSSLRFIKISKDEEKNRTKLKNILLLIIRMLIILLLVLSASRPLIDSPRLRASTKHPPTALAVILDTSWSMDYLSGSKSVLDIAKANLREINKRTESSDKVILITSDAEWNKLHTQIWAGDIPEDLIARIGITHAPLKPTELIALAEKKLADAQMQNREIYLLTDRQRADYPPNPKYKVNLIPLPALEPYQNLSCSNAEPQPVLVDRSRDQVIRFTLTNYGSSERKEVLVKAVLNGVKVAEKFVSIKAREKLSESIITEIRQDGWQSGYIEVLDERQVNDNRAYFAFPFYLSPRITVITPQPSLPLFLNSALSVYGGSGAKLSILDPASVNNRILEDQSLVIIHALTTVSPKLREILAKRTAEKKGVLYTLSPDLHPEYKSYLSGLFGLRIGAYQTEGKSIDYINRHHFISSLIADKQIRAKLVTDRYQASGSSATPVLSAGNDILIAVRDKNVLWLFDPDSRRSPWLLDASFPVIAFRSFQEVGTNFSKGETYKIGDIVDPAQLTLPDGTELALANRAFRLTQPGLYRLSDGDSGFRMIAVDPDRQEGDYQAMDFSRSKNYRILGSAWQKQIFFTRMGHDLWKILLLIALGLMAVEIILVKLEEARPGSSPQPQK